MSCKLKKINKVTELMTRGIIQLANIVVRPLHLIQHTYIQSYIHRLYIAHFIYTIYSWDQSGSLSRLPLQGITHSHTNTNKTFHRITQVHLNGQRRKTAREAGRQQAGRRMNPLCNMYPDIRMYLQEFGTSLMQLYIGTYYTYANI